MKVLGFTGSRADYYLQRPLFIDLSKRPEIEFSLIVSGGILAESNSHTLNSIKSDGFHIAACIELPEINDQTHLASISLLVSMLPDIINENNPDLCIVYADRYESFAFALASFHLNKIILHVEAGDLTYGGTFDDSIRHAITHISHLYSATTQSSCDILRGFGISRNRIHHTGLLSYDNLADLSLEPPVEILQDLGLCPHLPLLLATFHPIPRNPSLTSRESSEFFSALTDCSNKLNIIITSPNHDGGRQSILDHISSCTRSKNVVYVESLGASKYYSLMEYSKVVPVIVAGNSSSIIKESPYFGAHSLNVGVRQKGRFSAPSQINVDASYSEIKQSIESLALKRCTKGFNPYYAPTPASSLVNYLIRIFEQYSHHQIVANNIHSLDAPF